MQTFVTVVISGHDTAWSTQEGWQVRTKLLLLQQSKEEEGLHDTYASPSPPSTGRGRSGFALELCTLSGAAVLHQRRGVGGRS